MGPDALILLALAAAVAAFVIAVRRPHTLVRFAGGDCALVRGDLPPGLLQDLQDVARGLPNGARGSLGLHGQGDTLKLDIAGLDEFAAQRVRNVVLLQRSRIRRP